MHSSYSFANAAAAELARRRPRFRVELLVEFLVEFKLELWLRICAVFGFRRGAVSFERADPKENQTSFKLIQSCSTPCREKNVSKFLFLISLTSSRISEETERLARSTELPVQRHKKQLYVSTLSST